MTKLIDFRFSMEESEATDKFETCDQIN